MMKRRVFLGLTLRAAALPVLFAQTARTRWLEAVRSRRYPGKVKALDRQRVGRPARWAG